MSLSRSDVVWRGVLPGLLPLGLLVVLMAASVGVAAGARQLTAAQGFFVQQQTTIIVLVVGLLLAVAAYAAALVSVLRRVAAWQRDGAVRQATGALLALGITVLLVLLPLVLAALLPQHPAIL
jgi:hypothetical protein